MKKLCSLFLGVCLLALCLCLLPQNAHAATSGYYTYTVSSGNATITDCDTSITGAITIPETLGGYPVTAIGSSAFYSCTGLTSVTIPDSVISIGNSAFRGCTGVTSVTIPDSVTSIDGFAFSDCTRLTSATIPDSVTSIDGFAFSGCTRLTSVTIPDSVTSIGRYAFDGCTGLTSVTIPNGVTTIGDSAFRSCTELTSITIPDSVTSIGGSAFSGCSNLESITLPFVGKNRNAGAYEGPLGHIFGTTNYSGGVATEQHYADGYGYRQTYYIPQKLKSVTITDDTAICKYAFENCTGLTSITISDSVTSVGDYAFSECTGLTAITITDGVTSIGRFAFSGCTGLTSITIPYSVTSIGEYAFSHCTGLTSVTIPDSITSISNYAFSSCTELTTITIPDSITSIGFDAFYGCTALTSVTIPDSVSYIGCQAFGKCIGLTNIIIPNSVTTIEAAAFAFCTGLTNITIPESVTTIDAAMFTDCTALTSITIPDSVTAIGFDAFYGCAGLTSITIPDSVTSIGYGAFNGCSALNTVYYRGTDAQKAAIAIDEENESLTNAVWRSIILPTITPKYPSLSFEDEVYISVYFQVSDMTDVVDLGLVVSSDATVDENDTMVTEYGYKGNSDISSVRTHGIPAKSLGETIYFKVYAKLSDGSYVYSGVYNYSALAYAKDRIANSSNANLKKLCVAMLNYGAAAQTYMGYNVDSLANAALTADQLAMVEGYNSSMIASVTAVDSDKMGVFTRSGFGKCYPSISFEGAFSISYYFTPSYTPDNGMKLYYWDKEAFDGVDVLTVDNATGVLDMIVSGTAYKGAVEGIAAKEVDETIFVAGVYEYDGVTYCTGVIPYSLGAYCVDRAANGSAAMIPLAEATAVYGYYAKQYFA